MRQKDLVFVACRLLAVSGIVGVSAALPRVYKTLTASEAGEFGGLPVCFLVVLCPFVIYAFLWKGAGWLSLRVTPSPESETQWALTAKELEIVGFSTIGLVTFIRSLVSLLNGIFIFSRNTEFPDGWDRLMLVDTVIGGGLGLVFGAFLMLKARGVVEGIRRLRRDPIP